MSEQRQRGVVVGAGEVRTQPVNRARGARMGVLVGPDQGAPNFVTRRFFLAPGGRIPAHSHDGIEHEQVVVRGRMVVGLDDVESVVTAGDAVFIPSGTRHWYENRGGEEVEFICIVPVTIEYATHWFEEPPEGAHLEP